MGTLRLYTPIRQTGWETWCTRAPPETFNPIMAAAARITIVEAEEVVEIGELDPEAIVTPGVYVQRVVHVPESRVRIG